MIRFNFFKSNPMYNIPRFCKEGMPCELATLDDFVAEIPNLQNVPKEEQPGFQMFDCGYRISKIDEDEKKMELWNGCVCVDMDFKKFIVKQTEEAKYFEKNYKLVDEQLIGWSMEWMPQNFLFAQRSASGKSSHYVFYFSVEKNLLNFKKCAHKAQKCVLDALRKITKPETYEAIVRTKGVVDDCGNVPAQMMFLSKYPIVRGNDNITGAFDVNSVDWIPETYDPIDVEFREMDLSKVRFRGWKDGIISDWSHGSRYNVAKVLANFFREDLDTPEKLYGELIPHIAKQISNHTERELKRLFRAQYKPLQKRVMSAIASGKANEAVQMSRSALQFCREVFGIKYDVTTQFAPEKKAADKVDEEFYLMPEQYLSEVFDQIVKSPHRLIHVEAGCGVGKTRALIEYVKKNSVQNMFFNFTSVRVCFVTPMTSINRNNFEEHPEWIVVDGLHKNVDINDRSKSVCTTWDSFVSWHMSDMHFDLYVFDESHSLFLYDYRIQRITNVLLEITNMVKNDKRIMFLSGTPSLDRMIYNFHKVRINKPLLVNRANMIFYNESYAGWLYQDVREWICADANNQALIMADRANYKMMESFNARGLKVDLMFNKRFDDDVEFVNKNHTLGEKITLVSVYGQTGINIYAESGRKVRVYIATDCALSIIQYANRVRNRECVESVNILYKKENITNIVRAPKVPDKADIAYRLRIVNEMYKDAKEWIIQARMGLNGVYLLHNSLDNVDVIDNPVLDAFIKCEAVVEFESQTQVLYNRLISNFYDVHFIYLDNDVKDKFDINVNKASVVIDSGRWIDCLKDKNGKIKFDFSKDITVKKVLNDNCEKQLLNIVQNMKNNWDIHEEIHQKYTNFIGYLRSFWNAVIVKNTDNDKRKTFGKCGIRKLSDAFDIRNKLTREIGDASFICYLYNAVKDGKVNKDILIDYTAAHVASVFEVSGNMDDAKRISTELYSKVKDVADIIAEFNYIVHAEKVQMPEMKEASEERFALKTELVKFLHWKFQDRKKLKSSFYYVVKDIAGRVVSTHATAKEVCDAYGIGESTLRRYIKNNRAVTEKLLFFQKVL